MSNKKSNGVPAAPAAARNTKGPTAEASYLLSVTLEDARCFREKQTLDLSRQDGHPHQWTILLGNNGTGKTTVLQAIAAVGHSTFINGIWVPHGGTSTFLQPERFLARGIGVAARVRVVLGVATTLGTNQGAPRQVVRELEQERKIDGSQRVSFDPGKPATFCYAYGAARRMGLSALAEPGQDDPIETLFSDQAELRNAEEWLLQADYAASKPSEFQDAQNVRLEHIKDLLLHILPEVDDIRFTNTGGVRPIARVEFKTPYGWVPLRQLGYGYRTLIAWVVDFASRMVERYPDSPDPLAEPAVVLVDEIDLHLHPKWQRQLISYLTERFPNTQFIATAHSPLIVQAANAVKANLAVLRREGDHVVIENDPPALRGWSVDQLLTSELYGLPSPYPPQYDELFARREALLSKEKLSKADLKRLERLNKEMGELPLGDTAAQAKDRMAIKKALDLLQQEREARP